MDKWSERRQDWLNPNTPDVARHTLMGATQAQLEGFGDHLAHRSAIGQALIYLVGDLGAGKTTLVRHILRSLGYRGRVKSPTYALMETYQLQGTSGCQEDSLSVYHFDFYRLDSPQEWEDAGFRDVFASPGLKLVEWPQKALDTLPAPDCVIHLTMDTESTRHLTAKAFSQLGASLLA